MKTSIYTITLLLLSIGFSLSPFQKKPPRILAKGMATDIHNRIVVVTEENNQGKSFNKIYLNIYESPQEPPRSILLKNGKVGNSLFTINGLRRHFDGTFYIWGSRQVGNASPKLWAMQFAPEGQIIAESYSGLNGEWKDACQGWDGTIYLAGVMDESACMGTWPYQKNRNLEIEPFHSEAAATAVAVSVDNQLYLAGYIEENNRKKLVIWEKEGKNFVDFFPARQSETSVFSMVPHSLWIDSEDLLISGTAVDTKNREEAFWFQLDDKKKNIKALKYCCGTGNDGVRDMTRLNNGHYLLSGYTASHSKGARASIPLFWTVSEDGKTVKKILNKGKSLRDEIAIQSILWKKGQAATTINRNGLMELDTLLLSNSTEGYDTVPDIEFEINDTIVQMAEHNSMLQAGSRAFKWLTLTNHSKHAYANLHLEINEKIAPTGLSLPNETIIGPLFPKQTKRIAIPLQAAINVEGGTGEFIFQVRNKNNNRIMLRAAPDRLTFEVECQPKVYVSLPEKTLNRKGDSIKVQLSNPANTPLQNITVSIENCLLSGGNSLQDITISARGSIMLSFPADLPEDYVGEELGLSIMVYQKSSPLTKIFRKIKFIPFDYTQLTLTKEIACFLLSPNPGLYCGEQSITYNDDQVLGEVLIASKKPIKDTICRSCYLNTPIETISLQNNKSMAFTFRPRGKQGANYYYSMEFVGDFSSAEFQNKTVSVNFEGQLNGHSFTSRTANLKITPRDLHLLPIGVAEELNYSKNDAGDIKDAFETQNNSDVFREVYINPTFVDSYEVKNRKIEQSLRSINSKENDLLIFFMSAHGVNVNANFTLLTSDYYAEKRALSSEKSKGNKLYDLAKENGLQYKNDIFNEIKEKKGHKLILIDACHSGNTEMEDITRDTIGEPTNITTIVSSYGHRKSYECDKYENGIFSEAILLALDGAGDYNGDQIITIQEFYTFVKNTVQQLAQDKDCLFEFETLQVPTITQNGLPEDFPIYQLR